MKSIECEERIKMERIKMERIKMEKIEVADIKSSIATAEALKKENLDQISRLVTIFNNGFSNPECHYSSQDVNNFCKSLMEQAVYMSAEEGRISALNSLLGIE
jgi:hypothetical protein